MDVEELLLEVENNLRYNDKYYIDWMWNEVYERTCISDVKAYSECGIRYTIEGIRGCFQKIDGVFYKRIIAYVTEPESIEKLKEILEELKS